MKKIKCCKTMSWTIDFNYILLYRQGHIFSVGTPGFCCLIIKYNQRCVRETNLLNTLIASKTSEDNKNI